MSEAAAPLMPHEFTLDEQRSILESLRSRRCPACGNVKLVKQSFCPECWRVLTWKLRGPLYHPVPGYYGTFYEALMELREQRGGALAQRARRAGPTGDADAVLVGATVIYSAPRPA